MRAYRYRQLVYIPIYKNAASSYEKLFGEILKWQVIGTEELDPINDTIFAHISNPYHRHLRGTAQFLVQNELEELIDDPRFEKIMTSGYLDQHAYPLIVMFGDLVHKITWLPLDHPKFTGDAITVWFLRQHSVYYPVDQIPHENIGSDNHRRILARLKKIFHDNNGHNSGLFFLLDGDMGLYNNAVNRIYELT